MKALILTEQGGIEHFKSIELPLPQIRDNEVLIEVHAISINPVDIKTRKGGAFYKVLQEQGPVILGWDVSGIVTAIGSSVKKFRQGDAVFGMVNFPGAGKAYAEYVAAPEDHLALKPANISHAEAAAATLAALTAWQVLTEQAGIRQGQHLLMHAAAGGVGHYAVQIAKELGAKVTGTASAANTAFLQSLGVDQVIDYKTKRFEDEVNNVDIVFDPIGGETTGRSIQVLRPGGTLISIVGGVKEHLATALADKNIQGKNYLVHSSGSDMEKLAALLEQGKLRSYISHTYTIDEIPQAHQQIETGSTRGKLIVQIKPD